jgi:carbon storage regulator
MLVLSRKPSQQIWIGPDITITVLRVERNQVRLGITAPPGVTILRQELVDEPNAGRDRAAARTETMVGR